MVPQTNDQKCLVKATLQLASVGFKEADTDDINFMAILKQVEARYAVRINVDSQNNSLDIQAPAKNNASAAVNHLRSAMKLAGGEEAWHPVVLMGPTSYSKADFIALLELQGGDGARACISPKAGDVLNQAQQNILQKVWLNSFRQTVFLAAKQIRLNPSEMRMRVQLGKVLLQEWKRGVTEYTYDDLESLIKRTGYRGTFSFSEMMGTAQLARNLLEKTYESPNNFTASGNRSGGLRAVEPKHTLILTTENLRIETEVITVQETDSTNTVLRLGTAKGYRLEQRNKAVEIATSCPEHKYDWNLVVQTRVPVASLPFSNHDINKHAKLSPRANPYDFPDITMGDFTEAYHVSSILAKTAWVFKIQGSCYCIEVAMYNAIGPVVSEAMQQGGCGVDLFRPAWDEELSARNTWAIPRKIGEDCKELFPFMEKRLGDRDGLEAFARRVEQIHRLVSGTDDKPLAAGTDSAAPTSEENEDDLLLGWA